MKPLGQKVRVRHRRGGRRCRRGRADGRPRPYRVDLSAGKATAAGTVKGVDGTVKDIAILPAL
ncbi:hypothetical protein [Xanthobacter sp. KR7-225]|uniref:hypothetical protein n=1 Tax=Xanthobacter sp. KR7-225 TaxID=3156613 RepID=UPI0032B41422